MDPELRHLCAPHLLNWVVLQNACAAGARWFYMGESATQGAAQFKEFLGARRYEYDEIDFERIPFSWPTRVLRAAVKRAVGFRDPESSAPTLSAQPEQQNAGT
jgi:lipid II:glycine glycyltransferase (peptidoglycan interpeptide bridge formation enzyme)